MTNMTIIPPTAGQQAEQRYGLFLDRFLALLIDLIILSFFLYVVFLPVAFFLLAPLAIVSTLIPVAVYTPSLAFFSLLFHWLYFAGMERGPRGATIGKRAMRLRVVGEDGGTLSFGRASLRFFFKLVSAYPLLLGFFMALFTKKKQTLHDIVARSVVLAV